MTKIKDGTTDEFGLPKEPTGTQSLKEMDSLRGLLRQERGHFIWKKQFINFASLAGLIALNLFAGGKIDLSFRKCSVGYWTSLAGFTLIMIIVIFISVKIVAYE